MDGGGWYSGGASRCRAAEHHWIFGDSDDNRARAGHGMFCAASSNPRSIPVGYGLTDGCISDGYHSDCSSCKRDLWTLDNRHARVSRPPCDHISWPPSLSFLVNARLSELGGRGKGQREAALRIPHEKPQAVLVDVILKPQLQRFPMGSLECLQKQQVSFHCSHQCTKGLKFQSPTFQ